MTALLGRNGVGKTTTLRAILGLVEPRGRATLAGAGPDEAADPRIVRRGVGYVPEDREVFAGLTVEENLRLAERNGAAALRPRLRAVPGAPRARRAAGRHALRRPAADGRDRPGAAEREPGAAGRRADQGAGAAAGRPRSREVLARVARDRRRSLLVEQNLGVVERLARDAIVLDQGRVVHSGRGAGAARRPERVPRLLGVAGAAAMSTFILLTSPASGSARCTSWSPPACR